MNNNTQQNLIELIKTSPLLPEIQKDDFIDMINGETQYTESNKADMQEWIEEETEYWNQYAEEINEELEINKEVIIEEERKSIPAKKKLLREYNDVLHKSLTVFFQKSKKIEDEYDKKVDMIVKDDELSELQNIRSFLQT